MDLIKNKIATDETKNVISLSFLRDALWSWRRLVAGSVAAGLVLGIAVATISGGKYDISASLIPAESDAEKAEPFSQLPSLLSSGADLPVSKFKQFQAEIFSFQTAALLDRKYGTLCELNPNRCNLSTRSWKPVPAWRKAVSRFARFLTGTPDKPDTPQILDLVTYIKNNIQVTTSKLSSLTTISMTASDPVTGKEFLNRLIGAANQTIRDRDRSDLKQYVDYLSKRLDTLSSVGQRAALDNLLLTEERRLMLTEVQVAYAATPLDGPNATPTNAIFKIAMGFVAGLLLGCIAAIALEVRSINVNILPYRSAPPIRTSSRKLRDV